MQTQKLEVIATHLVSVVFPLIASEQVVQRILNHDADEQSSGNWFNGIQTVTEALLRELHDGDTKHQIILLRAIADYGYNSDVNLSFYSLDYSNGMIEMQFAFATPEDAKVFNDGLGNYEVESLHLLSLDFPLDAEEKLLNKIFGEDGEEILEDWFDFLYQVTAHLMDTLPDGQLKQQIGLLQAVAEYGNYSALTKGLYLIEHFGDSFEMQFEFVRPEDAANFSSGLGDYLDIL